MYVHSRYAHILIHYNVMHCVLYFSARITRSVTSNYAGGIARIIGFAEGRQKTLGRSIARSAIDDIIKRYNARAAHARNVGAKNPAACSEGATTSAGRVSGEFVFLAAEAASGESRRGC